MVGSTKDLYCCANCKYSRVNDKSLKMECIVEQWIKTPVVDPENYCFSWWWDNYSQKERKDPWGEGK